MNAITTMTMDAAASDAQLRSRWVEALDPGENLYAMYQSPDWLEAVESEDHRACTVLCREDGGPREVIAVLRPGRARIRFEVSHALRAAAGLRVVEVLGSQFIGTFDRPGLERVLAAAWDAYPGAQAVYLKSVRRGTALWGVLEGAGWRLGGAAAYRQHGNRPFHYIQLPAAFEEYLTQFTAKQRYNLKRQVRRMAEAFNGGLEVREVRLPGDVPYFAQCARRISERSWRARRLKEVVPQSVEREADLARIAGSGLLCAYLLLAGGEPAAFIVGYQYRGAFHYADLAYDEAYAKHSPGAVLLFQVIESLIERDRASYVNFGITDAQYKHMFGNRHTEDAEVLIMRPGLRNSALVTSHRMFAAIKGSARRVLAKVRNQP